ncbi:unnamed protein product [Allacma fusca]|uniref:SLC26A/SulP transporter domain-containing protein n=1 Tax=Allacma fusca TaxID=39272 RepID=A0A8J2JU49_9HEXA|nr:unnamed protein product [Allacma fusca]
MGTFIYTILGSCRELVIGPQAVLSLVSFQACGSQNPECVILLGFYSGVVHFVLGVLHLGFLVSFISEPVTVGFTAGAAIMIASGQIKLFLGLSGPSQGTNLITIWQHIADDIQTIRLYDSILGIICASTLIIMFKLKDFRRFHRWHKQLHILSLCRNALVLVVSLLLGYFLDEDDRDNMPFKITGKVPEGFPELRAPHFNMIDPKYIYPNGTIADDAVRMSFGDTIKFFGSAPLVIAFIAILQNVAIGKKFNEGATQIDATQEMIALGAVNLVGSGFFDAIPCCASFSRSSVNASSGAKSHVSALIGGFLMVLSLAFLTPYFEYIPKASLASIIIAAVIFMVDFGAIIRLWKFAKLDLLCCVVTFLASSLLGMEYGIIIGVGMSVLIILLKSLRPAIKTEYRQDNGSNLNYLFMRMDQGLSFPSVDYIQEQVIKKSRQDFPDFQFSVLVLESSMWTKWDYTTINAVVSLVDSVTNSDKILIFYRLPEEWIQLLSTYGLENPIVCRNMEELTSVLIELTYVFIGPRRETLAGKNVESNPEFIPRQSLRGSQSMNFNFVRKKYSIQVED